jgi:pimeloyl-ACP methyl ester carboxylesterase
MLIVFSHANSFPASTYGVLFEHLRKRGFKVRAVEKYGHSEQYPVTNNWPHLVQQLADFATRECEKAGEPAFLVGHSLGGILSLMAGARHPKLGNHPLRGVLLLDPPILSGWRATTFGMMKRTPLFDAMSPAKISRSRRNSWPSREAALEHFRHKKAFAKWEPQVLQDYIDHGLHLEGGEQGDDTPARCVLSFDRAVETAIYSTLPNNVEPLIRRHPPKCPVAFIGGRQSAELKLVDRDWLGTLTQGRINLLGGSHLFPMERPLVTAAAIETALRDMM